VNLIQPAAPQIYAVTLSLNTTSTSFDVSVTPQLPVGATLSFDLVHEKIFTEQPQYGAYTWNNVVTVNKNMVSVPYSTIATGGSSTLLSDKVCPKSSVVVETVNTYTWDNITMVQGDTVNGTISNPTPTLNLPLDTKCLSEKHKYKLYLNDVKLIDCPCCSVTVLNQPIRNIG
jgi:hypothetical protein